MRDDYKKYLVNKGKTGLLKFICEMFSENLISVSEYQQLKKEVAELKEEIEDTSHEVDEKQEELDELETKLEELEELLPLKQAELCHAKAEISQMPLYKHRTGSSLDKKQKALVDW